MFHEGDGIRGCCLCGGSGMWIRDRAIGAPKADRPIRTWVRVRVRVKVRVRVRVKVMG